MLKGVAALDVPCSTLLKNLRDPKLDPQAHLIDKAHDRDVAQANVVSVARAAHLGAERPQPAPVALPALLHARLMDLVVRAPVAGSVIITQGHAGGLKLRGGK